MRHPRVFCRALIVVLGAIAACAAARPAAAYNVTCTPSNVTLNFGPYDVLSGATLSGVGTITITCVRDSGGGQPVDVTYSASLALPGGRQMSPPSGTDVVQYQVYQDAADTLVWGDTAGVNTISGGPLTMKPNSTVTDTFSVYGLITPGGQDVSAASPGPPPTTYSQTLTITVTCTPSPPC
jgi:spore coat protein U-like protein